MPYNKPDVFVTVELTAASVQVPSPDLVPLIIGEQFFVVKEAYAGFVDAGEITDVLYPKLPDSYNDPDVKLAVDVTSQYSPQVQMVLGNGVQVDITDLLTYTSSVIQKPALGDYAAGVPYSGAIYVTYRAFSDQYSGVNQELLTAASVADLVALFGADSVGPANPLAFGMYNALVHGGVEVAGLAVGDLPDQNGAGTYSGSLSNATLSYADALDFSKAHDLYYIVPMTHDDYVLDVVLAHVNTMSTTGKQERRMAFVPAMTDFWPIRGDEDQKIWYSIIGEDTAALAYLNGGYDPSASKSITATADEGGEIKCTCVGHGFLTGDTIIVTGIADLEAGAATEVTITKLTADTFTIDDSTYTGPSDTGTFVATESAVGSEISVSATVKIRRIATGDGTDFGTYIVKGVSMLNAGVTRDTYTTTIATKNVTLDFEDTVGANRRYWVEFSTSALEIPATRVRIGDRLHIFGTDLADAFMATVVYPGVSSNDKLVEVVFGDTEFDHAALAETNQIRVYREAKLKEVVEGMKSMAAAYGDERLVLMAPDTVAMSVSGVATDVPAFYVAAQLAGEICQVGRRASGAEPGAYPFTGVRNPVVATFKSSRYFTDDQLNTAAEGGITWLVNDYKGGPVYARDTISTDMGTIETRDIVLGVERDFLAKTFRKALRPDLRRFRIDGSLLNRIALRASAIGAKYTGSASPTRTFREISVKEVSQDPASPDTVVLVIEAVHLYVLKYIRVTLRIVL